MVQWSRTYLLNSGIDFSGRGNFGECYCIVSAAKSAGKIELTAVPSISMGKMCNLWLQLQRTHARTRFLLSVWDNLQMRNDGGYYSSWKLRLISGELRYETTTLSVQMVNRYAHCSCTNLIICAHHSNVAISFCCCIIKASRTSRIECTQLWAMSTDAFARKRRADGEKCCFRSAFITAKTVAAAFVSMCCMLRDASARRWFCSFFFASAIRPPPSLPFALLPSHLHSRMPQMCGTFARTCWRSLI